MSANCITPQPAAAPGPRRCLSCGNSFASAGRHEWVCPRCKETETWQLALGEYAFQPASNRGDAE